MNRVFTLLIAALLTVGSACTDSRPNISAEEGRHFVTDWLRARGEGTVREANWYRTLDEALPNVVYLGTDGKTHTVSDLVAVGSIVEVIKGRGFTIDGEDAPGGTPSAFDEKAARWWTVHATITVDRAIGTQNPPSRVQVALPLDHKDNFDKMAVGLKALGSVVVFLDKGSPLVEYDPSLYVALEDSALIATIDRGGALSLPMLEPSKAAKLLAATTRLSDLEGRANTPRTIPLKPGNGPWNQSRADGI